MLPTSFNAKYRVRMAITAGLIIAAGSSRRLGQPKQLLPYKGATLLDATLQMARQAPFAQRLVTIGGAAPEVREQVDLDGFTIVDSVHHTDGCSSSIVSALQLVTTGTDGVVLLLGDQPHVATAVIAQIIEAGADEKADIVVCHYDDGVGHPFWFGRSMFAKLSELHGDKAIWKLIESGQYDVHEMRAPGSVPLDVDTWEDYEQLLATNS